MSDPFPPPPSSPSSMPPPPGPATGASTGATGWGATTPPPLYVGSPTASSTPAASTAGLRKATIVLFWCTAGATLLVAFAALNRKSVWDGYMDREKTIFDVDDADGVIGGAFLIFALLIIASAIVLSIWALRTARNARDSGATNVSPGLACGGWYIPLGNLVVPFVQLRKVAAHRRRSTSTTSVWQGLFIATYLVSGAFRSMGNIDLADDADELADRLSAQMVLAFVMTVLFVVMAVVATRAMRDIDGVSAERS